MGLDTSHRNLKGFATIEGADAIDTFYLLWAGSLVFFMQCGFGMLEAGNWRHRECLTSVVVALLSGAVAATYSCVCLCSWLDTTVLACVAP